MDRSRYFDHAATTFMEPEVFEAMRPWQSDLAGNTQSAHGWGQRAAEAVESARDEIARWLGAEDPMQIIFTSGATESNNAVAHALGPKMAVSPFEHSSLREPARHFGCPVLHNEGYTLAPPTDAEVAAVMLVNNETGAALQGPAGCHRHADITQAIGKLPVHLGDFWSASWSGHKFGGPLGVGALYLADPSAMAPWQLGGGHEFGLRAGTLNVAGIVGLATAIRLALQRRDALIQHVLTLRHVFLDELSSLEGWRLSPESLSSPAILSVTIADVLAETLVQELSVGGFAVSSGTACSSGDTSPSPTLLALGYSEAEARGTLRVSFSWTNHPDSTADLARNLMATVQRLRQLC